MQHKATHTAKIVIIASLLTVLMAGAYGYGLWEIMRTIRAVQSLETEVETTLVRSDVDRSTRSMLVHINEDREELGALFIKEDEIVAFIEHVEGFGAVTEAQIEILTVDVAEAEAPEEAYEWLELTISATGSWTSVYHTLALLERIPAGVLLTRAEIREQGGGLGEEEEAGQWSGRFDMRVVKKK